MADFTNRQLAEIISSTAINFKKSTDKIKASTNKLEEEMERLDDKIKALQEIDFKPDLSHINEFYREKTEENINRVNSRLKAPNLSIYLFASSVIFMLVSVFIIWNSIKSKQAIITEYHQELSKEKVMLDKGTAELAQDVVQWLKDNPKAEKEFLQWRAKKK